jgi:hypothetical protein
MAAKSARAIEKEQTPAQKPNPAEAAIVSKYHHVRITFSKRAKLRYGFGSFEQIRMSAQYRTRKFPNLARVAGRFLLCDSSFSDPQRYAVLRAVGEAPGGRA